MQTALLTEIKLLFKLYGTMMTAGLHFWLSTLLKKLEEKSHFKCEDWRLKIGGLWFFIFTIFCQFFRIYFRTPKEDSIFDHVKIHIWKIPVMPIKENHVSYHCVQIFGIFPPNPTHLTSPPPQQQSPAVPVSGGVSAFKKYDSAQFIMYYFVLNRKTWIVIMAIYLF